MTSDDDRLPDRLYEALHALSYGTGPGRWGDGQVWAKPGRDLAARGLVELWQPDVDRGRRRYAAKLTDAGWKAFNTESRARRAASSGDHPPVPAEIDGDHAYATGPAGMVVGPAQHADVVRDLAAAPPSRYTHADRREAVIDPRDSCPHDEAQVEAYIGNPGAENPADHGLPWEVLAPEQRDLDGLRSYVALGACGCGSRVVSVRTWEPGSGSPTDGRAWTSRWTRLVRDGAR